MKIIFWSTQYDKQKEKWKLTRPRRYFIKKSTISSPQTLHSIYIQSIPPHTQLPKYSLGILYASFTFITIWCISVDDSSKRVREREEKRISQKCVIFVQVELWHPFSLGSISILILFYFSWDIFHTILFILRSSHIAALDNSGIWL